MLNKSISALGQEPEITKDCRGLDIRRDNPAQEITGVIQISDHGQ